MLKPIIKTSLSLSGAVIMMGGSLVLSLLKLTDYIDEDINDVASKSISALSLMTLTYVLAFSRGISLWNYFTRDNVQTERLQESTEKEPLRKSTVIIASTAFSSSLMYFFFGSYLASNTLLKLTDSNETAPQIILWSYCWGSLMAVYINFTLPRAIKNGHDMIALIQNGHSNETKPALLKTIACTSLGTLSFGALANFLLNNAQQIMPVTRDFSSATQHVISYSLAFLCMSMFALGKSLESYQYFSDTTPSVDQSRYFTRGQKALLLSHKVVGTGYLLFITGAYFRVNLDLMDELGFDITPQWTHFPVIAIASLCTASSTFIEAVFSCGSMWKLTQKALIKNSPQAETLVAQPSSDSAA